MVSMPLNPQQPASSPECQADSAAFASNRELWLSWADHTAKDDTLKLALREPLLRQHLQPSVLWNSRRAGKRHRCCCSAKAKAATNAATQQKQNRGVGGPGRRELTGRFVQQMLRGCALSSTCQHPFCRSNPVFARRRLGRFQADLLAIELANRALEHPNRQEFQPHDQGLLHAGLAADGSGKAAKKAAMAAADGAATMSKNQQPFIYAFVGHIQRLLGYAQSSNSHQEMPTATGTSSKSCGGVAGNGVVAVGAKGGPEGWLSTADAHAQRLPEPIATKPEALDTTKLSTPQLVVNPLVKSVMSPTALIPSNNAATNESVSQHQRAQRASSSVAGKLAALVPEHLMACDDAGDPLMAVTQLDSHTCMAVAKAGGKLLKNTVETIFASPKLLSQCFLVAEQSAQRKRRTSNVSSVKSSAAAPLNMDVASALGFFHAVFGYRRDAETLSLATGLSLMKPACESLDSCLAAIEHMARRMWSSMSASEIECLLHSPEEQRRRKQRGSEGVSPEAWLESMSRALAIAALFLATATAARCAAGCSVIEKSGIAVPYPHEVRSLQQRLARLIVRVIYGPPTQPIPQEQHQQQRLRRNLHDHLSTHLHAGMRVSDVDEGLATPESMASAGQMVSAFLASGWYAVFARGNWIRDRWIRWWAKLPAEVVKAWTTVLENDAHGAVVQLTSGITSDRVIAAALVEDPVKWTGELELLRIISDSNSQLLCYMLEFHRRLGLPTPAPSADTDEEYVDYYDESLDEANIVWPDEFASPKILGCFDLKQELLRWVDRSRYLADPKRDFNLAKDRWAEENLFSPFYYPFLFSMDDKLQLHTVEVHSRMRLRYLSAHDRQAETVQNQRVLNIDAHAEQTVRSSFLPEWPLLASNRLAVASASNPYVVMAMRRDRLVQDAMDMIQANLERLRFPLKVRFVAGGEDGVDMGGVQKEFFALLLPQLLSPERGLFVFANDMAPSNISADSDGRGSGDYLWPNAASPHSLRDFEMVGVFLGIAFNNGISLDSAIAPLAPLLLSQLAFGHPQLDNTAEWPLPTLVNRVRGTFPSLVAGLQQLLEWDEEELGSVEDVFCRAFEVTVPDPLHIWQARRNEAIFGKMASSSAAGGGVDAPGDIADQFANSEEMWSDGASAAVADDGSGSGSEGERKMPAAVPQLASSMSVSSYPSYTPAVAATSPSAAVLQQRKRQQQMLTAPFDHLPLPNQTDGFVPSDASSMGAVAETATFPLIRDGGNIEVTKSNRRLYVRRYLEFIGYEHARAQIDALRRGFLRAADGITYRMTRTSEFLDWLCGHDADTAIDPKELERVATYDDEYTETHEVVRRFWRIVGGFTQTQLRQLLGFVTASDRLPLGGYRNITFVVQRNGPDTSRLPTALTCFGRLLLPAYGTEEKMRERLLTAIENSSGFGLV